MEIRTDFNVGDEVVFMHRNYPSEGIIDGVKIDVECTDKLTPDSMKSTAKAKIVYKIKPYFEYDKDYIYLKPDLIFADIDEMKQFFFPD